ncbi:MAG TPA: hypothetical protein VK745_30785 [Polyangiaceae bacterium]|jgi:hypothetical protein|nr:hypothetical protein [Polyangiaceae bacterium]
MLVADDALGAPFVDSVLKLANAGLPAIAVVVLFLTYRAVKQADGRPEPYQKLVRTFMLISIVIVFVSFISSLISYFRPLPPVISADLLTSGQWHEHWAGGNWITEARFEKQADGLHFQAATYRVIGGSMKGRRIFEWASDGAVNMSAKKLSFTGTRTDLEHNAKMPTRFDFTPGVSLIGDYGGPNNLDRYKLRFYDAIDESVREARSVDEIDECVCEARNGACDKCQR